MLQFIVLLFSFGIHRAALHLYSRGVNSSRVKSPAILLFSHPMLRWPDDFIISPAKRIIFC